MNRPSRQIHLMAQPVQPAALHDRAARDLSFIRRTMEGAATFTDVSGLGLILVGISAIGAAFFASLQPTLERWLMLWILEAVAAAGISFSLMYRKIRVRQPDSPTLSAPARKFLFGFWPAIFAGAAVTFALVAGLGVGETLINLPNASSLLGGIWLLLYGVGVMGAGAFSVRAVPLMGAIFLALGVLTLVVSALPADLMLALGFGGAHIGIGIHIYRRHGG